MTSHPIINDGKIFGRSANDMKGDITCMPWAIKAIQSVGWKPKNFGLELVVAEEHMDHILGTTSATKRLLEKGLKPNFCIGFEHTNGKIRVLRIVAFLISKFMLKEKRYMKYVSPGLTHS